MVFSRPTINEETHGYRPRGEHERDKSVLGLQLAAMFGRETFQNTIGGTPDKEEPDEHPDAAGDVRQAYVAVGEAVVPLEDEREGGVEEVEDAVDEGDVERHKAYDG